MSTRYRLPDAMGGLQYDAAEDDPEYPEVGFDLPGVSKRLWVARTDLVRITPSAPPVWSVVGVGANAVFQHRSFGANGRTAWFRTGSSRAHSWDEVCSFGTPVLLVPDRTSPVGEAVTLPFEAESGYRTRVRVSESDGAIGLQVEGTGYAALDAEVARNVARALWAASEAIEREAQS